MLLSVFACREPEAKMFPLSQKTKDYIVFKEGTKWVYKREGQSIVDTHTVISSKTEFYEVQKNNKDRYEEHHRDNYSSFFKDKYKSGGGARAASPKEGFESYSEVFYTSYFDVRCLFFVDMPVGYF